MKRTASHGGAFQVVQKKHKKQIKDFNLDDTVNKPEQLTKREIIALSNILLSHKAIPSKLLAGYTYLGQFIDHDFVLSRKTDVIANDETAYSGDNQNDTSPSLDLSCLYFFKAKAQALAMSKNSKGALALSSVKKSDLNYPISEHLGLEWDLPRCNGKALIPDSRNEEHILIAQLHVLFIKLHNYYALQVNQLDSSLSSKTVFRKAKQATIASYQSIIVNDFLKTIIDPKIYQLYFEESDNELTNTLSKTIQTTHFFTINNDKFCIPKAFSVAAYRFGHALVRDEYKINKHTKRCLNELFSLTQQKDQIDYVFKSENIIDWHRFFSHASDKQPAMEYFPTTVITLPNLPFPHNNLLARNLLRSRSLDLMSGFEAQNMVLTKLSNIETTIGQSPLLNTLIEDISRTTITSLNLSINKVASGGPGDSAKLFDLLEQSEEPTLLHSLQSKPPLWFYLLAESSRTLDEHGGISFKLSKLHSLIIAETFYHALRHSMAESPNLPFTDFKPMRSMLELIRLIQT